MLEFKEKSEDESRNYLSYDANLVFKYKIMVMGKRCEIRRGELHHVMSKKDRELEERRDLNRLIERNPNHTDDQLAKQLFRESEYYPR